GVGRAVLTVERLTAGVGREVPPVVRVVRPDAVRPAVVARLVDDVPLDDAGGTPGGVGRAGVRPVVGDQQRVGAQVHADLERVAGAHREDLRTGLVRPGLEEVALGDRVRAVVLRGDPQDLATQVVGVGRGALGVPGRPARALVDRAVPTRGEGVGVVTRGDVQV